MRVNFFKTIKSTQVLKTLKNRKLKNAQDCDDAPFSTSKQCFAKNL